MKDAEILDHFRSTGALLEGHFILRSGLRSGHFFQCARVCEHMGVVTQLIEALLNKMRAQLGEDVFGSVQTILAPAMGGLVLGQEAARQLGKRFIFAEKTPDGENLVLRRNFTLAEGEPVFIIEDVITRGGRVQQSIDVVSGAGGHVAGVGVLVNRSGGAATFNVPLTNLLEMSFPTYQPDALPAELESIPAVKPGS